MGLRAALYEPKCKQITRAREGVPGSSPGLCLHMEDRRTIQYVCAKSEGCSGRFV